jgi:hypothetical protein
MMSQQCLDSARTFLERVQCGYAGLLEPYFALTPGKRLLGVLLAVGIFAATCFLWPPRRRM